MTTRAGTATVLVTAIALAGCGESVDRPRAQPDSPGGDPASAPVTGPLPESRRVVCEGAERLSGIVDYAMESLGAPTPEDAARGWVQPSADQHLAVAEHASTAEVFVVRADGTVSGSLGLQRTSSGGWAVGSFEGCAGELRVHPDVSEGG